MVRPSSEKSANRVGGVRGVCHRWRRAVPALAFGFGLPLLIAGGPPGEEPPRPSSDQVKLGLELFTREWKPNDPRCHGGDGLGPVYNETSCVACHGQGGPGGAGTADMNVEVLSAIGAMITRAGGNFGANGGVGIGDSVTFGGILSGRKIDEGTGFTHFSSENPLGKFRNGFLVSWNGTTLRTREFDVRTNLAEDVLEFSCAEVSFKAKSFTLKADEDDLRRIHPGLVETPSVVLHHHGVEPGYARWRSLLKARIPAPGSTGREGLMIAGGHIAASERNSPPLFGLGLIDALPDEVLVATAEQEPAGVRGKVNRMKSSRIGRFGWKAQTTSLREFVLGACASELGLEAPGHRQAISPLTPEVRAKGLDLTQEECDALVAYVQALPAPVRLEQSHPEPIEAGRKLFESIGCADCHRPSLGNIEGIYSDLLLHDMGPDLASITINFYYGGPQDLDVPTSSSLAEGSEWRTPPLWGYRDSGPYLHDGRAQDLHEVVEAHAGQARASRERFTGLSQEQQSEIEQFLNSLVAPPVAEAVRKAHPGARRSVLGPSTVAPRARTPTIWARIEANARAKEERTAASRLKLAQNLEKMDNLRGALIFYREIVEDEPDSDAARTAMERIKALTGSHADRRD
jgi:mono/diheme cytochrome c family protein